MKLTKAPSRIRKISTQNQNRYESIQVDKGKDYEEFLYNGDEIIINERK